MTLKEYLTQRRKLLGMAYTAKDFAKDLGISENHLSRIVRGKLRPSFNLLRRIITETEGKVRFEDFLTNDTDRSKEERRKQQ